MRVGRHTCQISSHTLFSSTKRATWEITSYLRAQCFIIIGATNWTRSHFFLCFTIKRNKFMICLKIKVLYYTDRKEKWDKYFKKNKNHKNLRWCKRTLSGIILFDDYNFLWL
jgi:hypothetical protein